MDNVVRFLVNSVRGFRFKIAQIQRAWRRFKTMQKAQVVVVSIWLISLRSKTIKRRKQLEQELKDHKENKAKAKAGGRKQVDTVRLGLEETINSLPKYEVSQSSAGTSSFFVLPGSVLLFLCSGICLWDTALSRRHLV